MRAWKYIAIRGKHHGEKSPENCIFPEIIPFFPQNGQKIAHLEKKWNYFGDFHMIFTSVESKLIKISYN